MRGENMVNRTVSDELLAAAVRSSLAEQNHALRQAYEAGLVVDIDTHSVREMQRADPFPILTIRVSRPI
jgi:hypothetical protein